MVLSLEQAVPLVVGALSTLVVTAIRRVAVFGNLWAYLLVVVVSVLLALLACWLTGNPVDWRLVTLTAMAIHETLKSAAGLRSGS